MLTSNTFQECRTMLLLRTICLATNAFIMVILFKEEIFNVLKSDATKMERWDPTEIIASPFPLDVLRTVVFTSCRSIMTPNEFLLTTIVNFYQGKYARKDLNQSTMNQIMIRTIKYLTMMGALTVIVFIISIICGASPFENVRHTWLASFFVTTLACGYIQPKLNESIQMSIKRCILVPDYNSDLPFMECLVNEMNGFILLSVVVVLIPFMVLNILDGGFQIQRWPLPIIFGTFCGHMMGITLGTIIGIYRLYRLPFRKRDLTPKSTSATSFCPPFASPTSPTKDRLS